MVLYSNRVKKSMLERKLCIRMIIYNEDAAAYDVFLCKISV